MSGGRLQMRTQDPDDPTRERTAALEEDVDGRRPRRRARRRGRARRRERDEPVDMEEPADQDEQDAVIYESAQKRARVKARFFRDLIEYAVVVGALSFFLPGVAWIVGIIWGLGIASDFAKKIIEPDMRRRWVTREVERELRHAVPHQRRTIEDANARRIEDLSASIAHEIRNPLTAAKSLVQQMGEDPSSGDNVSYADVALEELDRVEKSISHLLRFAREEDVQIGSMRMTDVVESAVESFGDRLESQRVEVRMNLDGDGEMRGDPEKLRRVLINLLSNSLDALRGVDGPLIEVQGGENLAGTEVWVRVRDNGAGIEAAELERIFSPFYTSKDSGTGLGLAISKKLVDAHGGAIEVDSRIGGGTEFLLTFPKRGVGEAR